MNFDLQTMPQEDPDDSKDALDTLIMRCRDKDSQVRHASLRCLDGVDRLELTVLSKGQANSCMHN